MRKTETYTLVFTPSDKSGFDVTSPEYPALQTDGQTLPEARLNGIGMLGDLLKEALEPSTDR